MAAPGQPGIPRALVFLLLLLVGQICCQNIRPSVESVSLVVDNSGQGSQDFAQFVDPPRVLDLHTPVPLAYRCSQAMQVGLEVTVTTDLQDNALIYRNTWPCERTHTHLAKSLTLKLPPSIAYRPSHNNKVSITVKRCSLKVWLLEHQLYERYGQEHAYRMARSKAMYSATFRDPYERLIRPVTHCDTWLTSLTTDLPYTPHCPKEMEVYPLLTFPVALTGGFQGVPRVMPEYRNKVLRRVRNSTLDKPVFTISVWLYIMDYCPYKWSLCSIIQRLTWDDLYMTPLIYVNPNGQVHMQSASADQTPIAYLTGWSIPKDQWVHLVVAFERKMWNITVEYGENWSERLEDMFDVASRHRAYNNDTAGLYVVGGSEINPGFKGFVGQATLWRRRALYPEQIARPDPYHAMFELQLTQRETQCAAFMGLVEHTIYTSKLLLKAINQKKTCPANLRDFLLGPPEVLPQDWGRVCSLFSGRHGLHQPAVTWIRRKLLSGQDVDLKLMGKSLYENVTQVMGHSGLEALQDQLVTLKQASCYGYHDASYMLAVILNNGLGVTVQQLQSHSYLLTTAVEGHRMSLMAMGNKHTHGLDGLHQDYEQAYPYYKYVADYTRQDKDKHSEEDVYTEMIRLTNEWQMNEQTEEDGHLFLWFKHQASQGVLNAQRTMGRLLFWGSQGVKRNLEAAAEYYRISAETEDPAALFDYGIVLLRGQGTTKNETEAVEILEKSADLGHVPAINALGWLALEKTKNYSRAVHYFKLADAEQNPDAAHNLGHMYLNGLVPELEGKPDKVKAFEHFSAGSMRGQQDAAIMVALYNIRGHPNAPRDPVNAVEWARYVAEQNPVIGKTLYKGLKAYRKENWPESLLYYMLAANSGLEVATFNIAYLCEENKDYITSYIEKECIYRYYNISTRRQFHFVDPYAWIKMGDYHWYGCGGKRDARQAAYQYANAAYKWDPHAVFNLGFLVEQGSYVPEFIWTNLGISKEAQQNNMTLLLEVYAKCKESYQTEAYLPCTLAYLNIQAQLYWQTYHILIKVGGVALTMFLGGFMGTSLLSVFRGRALIEV